MHINCRISATRTGLGIAAAAAAAMLAAPPARASGQGGVSASCSTNPAACTVSAQNPGGQGDSNAPGTTSPGGSQSAAGPAPAVTCTDTPYQANAQNAAVLKAAQPKGGGHWVMRTCSGPVLVPTRTLTWIPNGKPALPDPRVLAAQALAKLALPKPVIHSSPGGTAPQTVQLPTWTWLPQTQFAPRSATASVPGESVTATATPISVTWSWGDGTTSVCQGPGTPYINGVSDPSAASPDCGHTYRQTSASAPQQRFSVTATLAWSVAWAGAGQSGTFPGLDTAATAHWSVRQIQSLIVSNQ